MMCADPSSLCSGCLWSSLWRPSSLHVGHAAESILVHHHSSGHRCSTLTSLVDIHSSAVYNPHYVQKWSPVPPVFDADSAEHQVRARTKTHTSGLTSRIWQWCFYFTFNDQNKNNFKKQQPIIRLNLYAISNISVVGQQNRYHSKKSLEVPCLLDRSHSFSQMTDSQSQCSYKCNSSSLWGCRNQHLTNMLQHQLLSPPSSVTVADLFPTKSPTLLWFLLV